MHCPRPFKSPEALRDLSARARPTPRSSLRLPAGRFARAAQTFRTEEYRVAAARRRKPGAGYALPAANAPAATAP